MAQVCTTWKETSIAVGCDIDMSVIRCYTANSFDGNSFSELRAIDRVQVF